MHLSANVFPSNANTLLSANVSLHLPANVKVTEIDSIERWRAAVGGGNVSSLESRCNYTCV